MVRFQRMATTQECAGVSEAFANSVTITFTGFVTPAGCNLVIGGVCWANTNVGTFRNFAPRADQYTEFYQWGNTTAWSASDPLTPAWTIVNNDAVTWDPAWDPCPMGWRMPSQAEMQALIGSGHSWVDANVRGTAVIGAFIGYNNTTCQLPNNMQGCIFIPAAGYRANNNGTLLGRLVSDNPRVHLWTSTPTANTQSVYGSIVATGGAAQPHNKLLGFNVRCVQ